MKITDIKEAGCNNLLMYSLQHGASLADDKPLISLINDEYFYLVNISDLNFYEVFRLTQMYRDKLRVLSSEHGAIPGQPVITKIVFRLGRVSVPGL